MENLMFAALAGNINQLYELIAENPTLLAQIDDMPLVNTPLHIAAEAGRTHFAIEIMSLKPSFGRKLNPYGFSPLDLAMRNGHDETVKRLIEIDSELIRVKGKGRWTPLHYAARMDNADLLAYFLLACPLSINDVTNRKENALHIAAANGKIEALEVLIGWIKRTENNLHLLRWKDEERNTLLHVIAYNYPLYAIGLLDILVKLEKRISTEEKNSDGLRAFDIISQSHLPHQLKEAAKKILQSTRSDSSVDGFSKYLRSDLCISDFIVRTYYRTKTSLTSEMVNCILIVVTLIVTASYQAAFQPPTSLHRHHSIKSSNIIPFPGQKHKSVLISSFYLLHSSVFAVCVSVIIIVVKLNIFSLMVHMSLIGLYLNYSFMLLYNQDVDTLAKILTLFTCISTYMILVSKFVFKVVSGVMVFVGGPIHWWKLIGVKTRYMVRIQRGIRAANA